MKDKILDSIKSYINQYEEEGGDLALTFDNWKLILDYITNLQEENEELTKVRYSLDRVELERRIDKAIEYIVTHREAVDERDEKIIFWLTDDFDEEDLLDILEGE